jgi:Domain of unknown function (DUF4394)
MMKKLFAMRISIVLIVVSILLIGIGNRSSATVTIQTGDSGFINRKAYGLSTDNNLELLIPGATQFIPLGQVTNLNGGNLIGIDFRPAKGNLYGLTDKGGLYTINTDSRVATLVSTLSPPFPSGYQSLMDFNPVLDAIRLIGSDTLNYAVVNANGDNFNQTAVQTFVAYAAGDPNAGVSPKLTAGAYTNNRAGAANTIFYAIDHNLDTFVTIATKNATGSSNTGGGQLQTIGQLVSPTGGRINIGPNAGIDIYTDANGVNTLVGVSGRLLFAIDLKQINQNLQLGTPQSVAVRSATQAIFLIDGFMDLAIQP